VKEPNDNSLALNSLLIKTPRNSQFFTAFLNLDIFNQNGGFHLNFLENMLKYPNWSADQRNTPAGQVKNNHQS
jgi:hypothetical protein